MLHLQQFKKYYHHRLVLAVDELRLSPGIYWVKGVNGSGKSTLLKALAGILHFEGEIVLNKSLNVKRQTRAYRSLVNFAEAEPVFPPYLTGREMTELFISAKNGTQAQAEEYISSMRMQDYINDPVSTYSSGMLKKLSLVLAFIGNPSLILLDEPLITMDSASLLVLYKWIRESSSSFLLSSHQEPEAGSLITTGTLLVAEQTLKLLQS